VRELSTIRHRIAVSDGAQLLTVGQVRKRYSASDRWIARRLADENFPKPIKFGPGISAPSRWRRDAGLVWEAAREVQINSGSSRSGRAAYGSYGVLKS
jgi:predicted DNA-binding transcriptional regulator AlpA